MGHDLPPQLLTALQQTGSEVLGQDATPERVDRWVESVHGTAIMRLEAQGVDPARNPDQVESWLQTAVGLWRSQELDPFQEATFDRRPATYGTRDELVHRPSGVEQIDAAFNQREGNPAAADQETDAEWSGQAWSTPEQLARLAEELPGAYAAGREEAWAGAMFPSDESALMVDFITNDELADCLDALANRVERNGHVVNEATKLITIPPMPHIRAGHIGSQGCILGEADTDDRPAAALATTLTDRGERLGTRDIDQAKGLRALARIIRLADEGRADAIRRCLRIMDEIDEFEQSVRDGQPVSGPTTPAGDSAVVAT